MSNPMTMPLHAPALLGVVEEPRSTAFEQIYAEHFRGVWRILRRLGVPEAQLDDAAQDVFVVVHRRLSTFDGKNVRSWLYAIATRVAVDHRRAAVRNRAAPISDALADRAPGPGQVSELSESVRLLHVLLEKLDERKREVFVLSELEQLSAVAIAEVLGSNINTVYSRLRAARSEFDAALQRHQRKKPSQGGEL